MDLYPIADISGRLQSDLSSAGHMVGHSSVTITVPFGGVTKALSLRGCSLPFISKRIVHACYP